MSDEFNATCYDCGIKFGFSKEIEKLWRESAKTFYCPNGHSLHWPKPNETEDQKELKAKLATALQDAEAHKKRADDL
ncbi:MAG: hypothetical protein ACRDHW_17095 [Ktedonobacteraceae bacterium]